MRNLNLFLFAVWFIPSLYAATGNTAPDCSILPHGVVLTDSFSCRHYYQCNMGRTIRKRCLEGLYFDEKMNVCNLRKLVQCTGRGVRISIGTSTENALQITTPASSTTCSSPFGTTAVPCSSSSKSTTTPCTTSKESSTPDSITTTPCSSSTETPTTETLTTPCSTSTGSTTSDSTPTTTCISSTETPTHEPTTTTPCISSTETPTPEPTTTTPCSTSTESTTPDLTTTSPCRSFTETPVSEPTVTTPCTTSTESTTPDSTTSPCSSSAETPTLEPTTTTPCSTSTESTTPDLTTTSPCSSSTETPVSEPTVTTPCSSSTGSTTPVSRTTTCSLYQSVQFLRKLMGKFYGNSAQKSKRLSKLEPIYKLCLGQKLGTIVRDPEDCATYYMCNVGQAVVNKCSKGFYFDSKRGFCNIAKLVKCDEEF